MKKSFKFPSILLTENNFRRKFFRGPFFRVPNKMVYELIQSREILRRISEKLWKFLKTFGKFFRKNFKDCQRNIFTRVPLVKLHYRCNVRYTKRLWTSIFVICFFIFLTENDWIKRFEILTDSKKIHDFFRFHNSNDQSYRRNSIARLHVSHFFKGSVFVFRT